MGEAFITRRGGFSLSDVTVKRLPEYTEENLYKGLYVLPTTVYDSNDNVDREGIAVFADGVLIYNELDYYGYIQIGTSGAKMRFYSYSNFGNYNYAAGAAYKIEG